VEVTEDCIKIHHEQLHGLYCTPNNIQVMKLRRKRWAGHVERMSEDKNTHRGLLRKRGGKRRLRRPRRNWKDNILKNLRD
jgi:ribosomal protein S15P/S13E